MTAVAARHVTVLAPLAVLSVACTIALTRASPGALVVPARPLFAAMPVKTFEDPASFSIPGNIGLGIAEGDGAKIIAASSTNGIPTAALAAYQRAETVINAADKACHIDWALIAAIGRVESDHGRYGGNTLDTKGVSHPGIYGIALDGTNNTQAISDTDAGQYDKDKVWDRAVGAMQFIPSTWSVVGVDADGDGKRNPQDIDDSALAAAVYLCSGTDDLGAVTGRRAAVYRYNHSNEYVDLVLAIRDAYLQGDYTSVPNYLASAYTFSPPERARRGPDRSPRGSSVSASPDRFRDGVSASPTAASGEPALPQGPISPPASSKPASADPKTRALETAIDSVHGTLYGALTISQATVVCIAAGYTPLLTPAAWNSCTYDHSH